MQRRIGISWLVVSLAIGGATTACSSSSTQPSKKPKATGGGVGVFISDGGPFLSLDAGSGLGFGVVIKPADPVISTSDPVQFTVTGAGSAQIEWHLSNPYLGTIDQNGLFTPNGSVAGGSDVEVRIDGKIVAKVHITVNVTVEQNGAGATSVSDAGAGGPRGGRGGGGGGGRPPRLF